jgi:glycosyltransferase involved in cell wall biosynthesis
MQPDVSIVIPVYNETNIIGDIVLKIKELYPDYELIVVNDGSTDETARVAHNAGATVYSHPYNIGNGAAVKTGIRVANGKILVFMDGDGQHRPEDIGRMLKLFPGFDMVVGARQWGRAGIVRSGGWQQGIQLACNLCNQVFS